METIRVKLQRILKNDSCIIGAITILDEEGNAVDSYNTLELPWKNNLPDVSCIPVGSYNVEKVTQSPLLPYPHFIIPNIYGRSGIAIHVGNFDTDTHGCILVGIFEPNTELKEELSISHSEDVLQILLDTLPDRFGIEISEIV